MRYRQTTEQQRKQRGCTVWWKGKYHQEKKSRGPDPPSSDSVQHRYMLGDRDNALLPSDRPRTRKREKGERYEGKGGK